MTIACSMLDDNSILSFEHLVCFEMKSFLLQNVPCWLENKLTDGVSDNQNNL